MYLYRHVSNNSIWLLWQEAAVPTVSYQQDRLPLNCIFVLRRRFAYNGVFSFLGTLTVEQANQVGLTPRALVDQTPASAVSTTNLGMTSLIVTGVISVISSLTIFSVLVLGLRAREKRQAAKRNYEASEQEETAMPTPKWSRTNNGTVRSLSSISRINPTFEDDNFSMTSTNTDLSSTTRQ